MFLLFTVSLIKYIFLVNFAIFCFFILTLPQGEFCVLVNLVPTHSQVLTQGFVLQ